MYHRRETRQSTQNMSDTEREALLMNNYIDLMTNVLTSSAQVTESFNVSMRRILDNCNSLFNNYYQWGRDTNPEITENLSTATRGRRNRRSRRNNNTTTNLNTNQDNNTSQTSTFNLAPTSLSGGRSWADIIGNSETRTSNRGGFSNSNTRSYWGSPSDVNIHRNRRTNIRSLRQSPISTNTTNRIIRPQSNLTRTNLQTFINNTLNTGFRNYTLSREQINSVLTTSPWREIQSSSDQTVCPITQVQFQEDEMVSRITRCGHIFSTNAINNYLLNYDNRCPVCRLNLSNISTQSTDNSFTSTTTPAATTTNERPANTETSSTISNELNNAVNLASNAFVNELTNNLTNNLFGNQNSPAQISAEYSLFLPTTTTNTQNTTNTPPQTAFNWSFTPNTTTTTNVSPPSHPPPPLHPPGLTLPSEQSSTETTQTPESDAARYVTTYVEQQNPETKEEIEEPEVDTDADTDVEDEGEEKIEEERTNRK